MDDSQRYLVTVRRPALSYPNIDEVLLGKNLGDYVRANAERAPYLINDDLRLPRQRTLTAGLGWQIDNKTSLEADWGWYNAVETQVKRRFGGGTACRGRTPGRA